VRPDPAGGGSVAARALGWPGGLARPAPPRLLLIVLLLGVSLLVGLPLFVLLLSSLKGNRALPFDASPLTLQHYADVYGNPATYVLLLNTFVYAACSLAIGLAIAFTIAWLVERTDMPLGNLVFTAMFIPMATPGLITALGWVLLVNPQNGVLNLYLRPLLGWSGRGPLDIYTFGGMVFVTGLVVVPTMFVMLSALMRNMDPALEEAARMSGASLPAIWRHVTGPLLLPGVAAVLIYFVIILIEYFEVPLVIGLTGGVRVLSTQVYLVTRGESYEPAYGTAAAYALVSLVLGSLLILLYARITRQAERFAVLGGKGFRPRRTALGRWRWPALGFVALYLLLELGLPFAILLWSSLLRFYQPPSLDALARLGLGRYDSVFLQDPRFLGIVGNTLLLMLTAATVCLLLALLIAWVVVRVGGPGARWLDLVSFLPTAMPAILVALALLLLTIGTPLQGTVWVIAVGHVIRYLPFATRTMHAGVLQIHRELEEAATTSGAGTLAVFRRVLAPLLAPALVNGWLWVAANSMRDITFPLMLVSTSNTVMGMLLWEYWSQGLIAEASAIAVVLVLALAALVLPVRLHATGMGAGRL
jgi:iron(III) transport system permease protein